MVGGRSGRLGAAPGGAWVEGGHLPVRRWLRDETPNVLEDGVEQLVVDNITKAEAEGRKRESDAAYIVQMRRESGAAHYIVAYGRHARPCCGKEACRTTRLNSVSYVNARAASSDICDGTGRRCVSGGAVKRENGRVSRRVRRAALRLSTLRPATHARTPFFCGGRAGEQQMAGESKRR